MQLVSVDIGGTHARFAIAEVEDGHVVALGEPVTLKTAEHASLQTAWQAFAARHGAPLPKAAAISVASPITGDIIRVDAVNGTLDALVDAGEWLARPLCDAPGAASGTGRELFAMFRGLADEAEKGASGMLAAAGL